MAELVEIAFVGGEPEALMIQALLEENEIPCLQQQVRPSGPQLGYGLMNPGGGARRVMVHAHRAKEARAVLGNAQLLGDELQEPVNAEHLEDDGRRWNPRSYGLIGGYARAYLVSVAAMALAFGGYLLLRAAGLL